MNITFSIDVILIFKIIKVGDLTTEKNNRVKMTQSRFSNGRGVNVTHVVCRVDLNRVFLPFQ